MAESGEWLWGISSSMFRPYTVTWYDSRCRKTFLEIKLDFQAIFFGIREDGHEIIPYEGPYVWQWGSWRGFLWVEITT